ncbi:tyrosine-type recombinase/integrase [Dictyobacter kobayashii]|uniref:Tyrosine recombinase XerD n=1 Tax=Dictyobacter kobayashii TaxID=2014872 RepID=A0A402AMG6_9CHLR|nr:tyrosine-type recombinase/integrase [Dictyobacter kobayashii]GCE20371.1 tyrosine recombinase XerD [Dictyobacter kobayashii]
MRLDETVEHYLRSLITRRLSIHTQLAYRHALALLVRLLADICGVTDLERVTVLHLRQCVQHLLTESVEVQKSRRPPGNGSTLSAGSVCDYIRRWKTFFNWCQREDLIEKNPGTRLEYPKTDERMIDAFTVNQIEHMISIFDLSTPEGFRDYVILLLMLDTGIRRSEVATLRVEDVHDTYIGVFGKGRKERQVGIHPEISNLLWKYIHKYRRPADGDEPILFLSVGRGRVGMPFGRGGMNALIRRLKAATGIDDVRLSAHTFRHTFACMYLDAGGDVFSLSREMGHTDIKTTERYLRSFTSKRARLQHDSHSPINSIKLRSHKKPKK